jgi:ribA/ribD-fused uncharacterized protein
MVAHAGGFLNFRRSTGPAPVLFYRRHPFSNFWICKPFTFTLPASCRRADFPHEFRVICAETAIMLAKAVLMSDRVRMEALVADSAEAEADVSKAREVARKAKKLGREVTPFDADLWEARCEEVAAHVVRQKFQSSEELKMNLLSTGRKRIAEASKSDRRWGIGLSCTDPKAQDPDQWRGCNLLGNTLEETRIVLGGEPPAKRQRLSLRTHVRPWGFYINAKDAALPNEVLNAAGQVLSVDAELPWHMKNGHGGIPTHARLVCGGRNTAHIHAPPEAVSVLQAAAAALQKLGQYEAAHLTTCCDNVTLNVYRPGARLGMHQDPAEYEPFIVCVCFGAPRTMTFVHRQQGRQTLKLSKGDIYVLRGEGYTEWFHGMSRVSAEAASITGRVHRA